MNSWKLISKRCLQVNTWHKCTWLVTTSCNKRSATETTKFHVEKIGVTTVHPVPSSPIHWTALLHYFSVRCAKIYLDLSLKLLKQSAQVWSLSQPHSNWLATQYQKLLIWGSHRNTTCVQMHEWISRRREQAVPALARQKGGDGQVLLTLLAWVPAGLAGRAEFQHAVTTAYQLRPGRVRLLQLAHGLARWWQAPCPARVQQHLCGGEQKNSVCVYPFCPAVYGHVTMVTLRRLSIRLFSVNLP